MAQSLDQLIEFLLEEIAIGGELGLPFSTIAASVRDFYTLKHEQDGAENTDHQSTAVPVAFKGNVDRPFLSKVLKWLSRHPDISIGKHHQYNNKSLDEIEALFPDWLVPNADADINDKERVPSGSKDVQPLNAPSTPVSPTNCEDDNSGPRLYVNELRMWIAICGHPPDLTRILPMEWTLLVHIAASRRNGILQGNLCRAAGQDKRSVPRRTDTLHAKGYVIKKVIYLKGNKTSLLYLPRFFEGPQPHNRVMGSSIEQLTVRDVAKKLFDVLQNNPLVPLEDLTDALGMTTVGRHKILTQLIRSFSKLGCLKRVKTAFEPAARVHDLKTCIQYLKAPTEDTWRVYDPQIINFNQSVEVMASYYENEAGQTMADAAMDTQAADDHEEVDPELSEVDAEKLLRSQVPQWNPDRNLSNVLFDIVNEAGADAVTNSKARRIITGHFVKRTLESLLVRMSNRALQAQPPHLRHLAILKTHEQINGYLQYLFHTYHGFENKVRTGKAKWEDVAGGKEYLRQLAKAQNETATISVFTKMDEWGFGTRSKPSAQSRNGEVSMMQLLHETKLRNLEPRAGEPTLLEVAPGKFQVSYREPKEPSAQTHAHEKSSRKTIDSTDHDIVVEHAPVLTPQKKSPVKKASKSTRAYDEGYIPKGRPRKFFRGSEKYWRDTLMAIVQARDEDNLKTTRKAGATNDPEALKFFNSRPTNFDSILVEAIEQGLPLAQIPDIGQEWVNKMTAILRRSRPGLYITPTGVRPGARKYLSMHLILRSSRLEEIDWSARPNCWPWRFLSSSYAHSLPNHPFEAGQDVIIERNVNPPRRSERTPDTQTNQATSQPQSSYDAIPPEVISRFKSVDIPVSVKPADLFPYRAPDLSARSVIYNVHPSEWADGTTNLAENLPVDSRPALHKNQVTRHLSISKADRTKAPKRPTITVTPTRSTRKRKLTQKAAEGLEIQNNESQPTEADSPELPLFPSTSTLEDLCISQLAQTTKEDGTGGQLLTAHGQVCEADQAPEVENALEVEHVPRPVTTAQGGSVVNDSDLPTSCAAERRHLDEGSAQQVVTLNASTAGVSSTMTCRNQEVESIASEDVYDTAFLTKESLSGDIVSEQLGGPTPEAVHVHSMPLVGKPGALDGAVVPVSVEPQPMVQGHELIHEEAERGPMQSRRRSRDVDTDNDLTPATIQATQTSPAPRRSRIDGQIEISRAQVAKTCRILVMELIGLCSGLLPNVPWTLRRSMVPKWHEAGVVLSQLNAKNVRSAVKSLCDSGKLKQITFAFRAKSGVMVTMSVIALRGMDAAHPAVIELQRRMQEIEPADYIPFELDTESRRVPSDTNRKRFSKDLQLDEINTTEVEPSTPRAPKRRRKDTQLSDPLAVSKQGSELPRDPMHRQVTRSPLASPSPEPVVTLNTGFLTLSVPRLKELQLPTEYEYKFKLTQEQLVVNSNPNPSMADPAPTVPVRKVGRPVGPRGYRNARFDPKTHKLIWKTPQKLKIPSCLDEIPNIKLSRDEAALGMDSDLSRRLFEAEVDCVAAWEEKFIERLADIRTDRSTFINHFTKSKTLDISRSYITAKFQALVSYDETTGAEVEVRLPDTESWPPFATALQQLEAVSAETAIYNADYRPAKKSRKRKEVPDDTTYEDEIEDGTRIIKKRKRIDKTQRPRRSVRTNVTDDEVGPSSSFPVKRNRVAQLLRAMTEEERYHVVIAVILVRTLVGGIEKFIDWQLVRRLIPGQELHNIKDAWKSMANRYRNDVQELVEGLQLRYIEALSDGEVPTVNFDAIYQSDWEGIFRWGLANLDKMAVQKIEDLPATRGQLLHKNDYLFTEPKSVRDLLTYNASVTVPKKEEVFSGIVFGKSLCPRNSKTQSLETKPMFEVETSDIELSRAKSWIMATLLTPETTDPKAVQTKLLQVAYPSRDCEMLLQKAVRSLQRDRLVSRAHRLISVGKSKSRSEQGLPQLRQYELSARFFDRFDFRRMVTTTMLKRAAKYKFEVLDPAFSERNELTIVKDTILEDGDMVAILNLLSMNMLRIRPGKDVPASLWGLDWQNHGYTTRLIDKKILGFTIILESVKDRYIHGDPLSAKRGGPSARIPRGEIDQADNLGRVPIWFDILKNFHQGTWEMALGAILGLVSTRPGISVHEIIKTVAYGVTTHETEMILRWADQLDLVKRTSSMNGWQACEWWWMGVGAGGEWNV